MPQVAIGAVATGLISYATGATIAAATAAAFGSLILGGLSYALAPKPKKQSGPVEQVTSSTFTIRQPDSTRKHIYGMTRFTDCYAHIVSTGANGKIHAAVIICDDEAKSIDEVWVNDYPVSPDQIGPDGWVTAGRYAGKLRIIKKLGSPNQVADPTWVSEVDGWKDTDRLRGICHMLVTLVKDQDVYPNGMPNFSCIGRFRQLYDPRINRTRWTPNCALFCYDYLAQADFGFLADADDVNLTNIAAEASIADEIVDTNNLDTDIASVAASTDIITLDDDRLQYEICDRVELVTGGTPPGGLATGTDYYVIPYQIKDTPRIQLAASLDDAIEGIAINITSAGSGSMIIRKTGEPRYHGAGVVDTADTLEDNLNSMLTSIAGRAINTGGAWRLLCGAWREPEVEFTLSDMRGTMETRGKIPMASRFNTVNGVHVSQINDYQRADYPAVRIQSFIDADNGREYPRDLPLNFTTRPTTAKRIAKIEVFRGRFEVVRSYKCSMRGLSVQAGDNIFLTMERMGWEQQTFELTNFQFMIEGGDKSMDLLTKHTIRLTSELIYEWAAATDEPEIVLPPVSSLPNFYDVEVPTGFSFSSRQIESTTADINYALVAAWTLHPDAFVVNNGFIEVQSKLAEDPDMEEYWRPSFFVAGAKTFTDVLVSSVNTAYDIRIRAVNNLGVHSPWALIENAIVGSSGGVGSTENWQGVTDGVTSSEDWGGVTDAVTVSEDWGGVV